MDKTIFFHIGTVKTGSTFIQKFCYDNPDFLLKNDLAYPYVTPAKIHLPRYTNADFLDFPEGLQEAKAVFDGISQSRILISEEGLMGCLERINNPVFEGFRKRVILYLRPPADLVVSWAAEKTEPYNATIDTGHIAGVFGLFSIEKGIVRMMDVYLENMNEVMAALSMFEKDDVFIKPFERSQFVRGALLNDFFSVMSVDVPYVEAQPINQTQTRKYCDISHLVWTITQELGVPELFNYPLVLGIYEKCRSGDDRPVVDTLPDSMLGYICWKLESIETHFSERYLDGRPLFTNRFPKNYGSKRSEYEPVDRAEVERLTKKAINNRFG